MQPLIMRAMKAEEKKQHQKEARKQKTGKQTDANKIWKPHSCRDRKHQPALSHPAVQSHLRRDWQVSSQ